VIQISPRPLAFVLVALVLEDKAIAPWKR